MKTADNVQIPEMENTRHGIAVERIVQWTALQEKLLCAGGLEEKSAMVSKGVVDILKTDFAGIWIVRDGDRCQSGCPHKVEENCRDKKRCLHLIGSSGCTAGSPEVFGRIPLGCDRIGKVASGEIPGFRTNDIQRDPEMYAPTWAAEQNLRAYAGYRLLSLEGLSNGVLATFSRHEISKDQELTLNAMAAATSHFVQTERALEMMNKPSKEPAARVGQHEKEVQRVNRKLETEIEKRRKNEAELLQWFQIFNHASIGIITSTIDGYHVDKANPAFAEMHGYVVDELKGMPLLNFIAPKYRDKIPAIVKKARKIKKIEVEIEGCRKNGSTFPIMGSVTDVNDDKGRFKYRIISGQDISERQEAVRRHRRLEDRVFRVQKMESLGTLASGIAHDFNNILAIIMIQNELAQRKLTTGRPLSSHLEKILQASERAKKLVQQILSFSRRINLDQEPVWIDLIVKESLKLLRASLPSTIDIRTQIEYEIDAVLCDPTQIHQIIMNLCTNAGYAMRDKSNGILEVYLKDTTLDQKETDFFPDLKPGKYVQLIIRDNGVGMDENVRERIFDPYFTTKPKGEGTGLGLSVVHGIMTRLGGAIKVHSQPGRGSEFCVYFPCTKKTAAKHEKIPVLPANGDESVLFLDDEREIVLAAGEMLADFGYRVIGTTNPVEALQMLEKEPQRFDIVITDQTMPGITGMELARRIESIRSDLPVVLCTGYNEDLSGIDDQPVCIQAFLKKPFEMLQAARTIRKILD